MCLLCDDYGSWRADSDGANPNLLLPYDEAEVQEMILAARREGVPLEIGGGTTKAGLGRPAQEPRALCTAAMTGITLHEPAELVIAAQAGTPLVEVEAALEEAGQRLAFEPADYRGLYGYAGDPTVGGVVATNLSGPRRIQTGAARDSLIGVRFVSGRGDIQHSGGRVMKNVTGYDLVKLSAGAFGTLGVLTEVTFKVLPKPETTSTLVVEGLDDVRAVAALSAALGSPYEVSGAAHLPRTADKPARTVLRLEGFGFSVDHRAEALARALKGFGPMQRLAIADSTKLWREIRDVVPLIEPRDRAVWKISLAPGDGPRFVAALGPLPLAHFYDWGGGLVWLSTSSEEDASAASIRGALKPFGGHATLVRAPHAVRAAVEVFQPLSEPLMRLTRDLKQAFDPDRVLNPGRMYAGI